MLKKSLFVVVGLGVLGVLFFGRDAVSYVCTSASRVQDSVRSNIPVEFEIDRARTMVKDLVPDIRRNMHVIAKEEVEIENLEKQIAVTEEKLGKQQAEVLRLQQDVASEKGSYVYNGRHYTTKQVKVDLANRFERYKTNDATLASLREIHSARKRSLEAARQKLENMLAAKRQLEVDVENLEARLKMVEVAQTTSEYNFDDSQLARVKDLMTDIRTRLSVAEKLVSSDHQFDGEIQLDDAASDHIVDEVAEYFEFDRQGAKVADATR
jgi:chromosome segregation ATPase